MDITNAVVLREIADDVEKIEAKNKRLKKALEKISQGHPDGNLIFLIEIAKQVLKDELYKPPDIDPAYEQAVADGRIEFKDK